MLNNYQHINSLVNFATLNETMQPGAWYAVYANEEIDGSTYAQSMMELTASAQSDDDDE